MSVIVSTLDRAPWLDRALRALAYQRHPAFEVIVVAGPCRDDTAEVLARHRSHILMATCSSANLSASRNIGLRLAQGDVVAFLDDDAAPEPDWLQHLCTAYDDPEVGGAGGFIRDQTGVGFQCRVMAADRFGRSAEVGSLRRARLDAPGPGVERYLSLTGANSSFRRRALLEIGGFDEAYAYFLDETDVCLRLVEAGWRLTVSPQAEVHHAYAPNAQRRADRAPLDLSACVRSTAYFTMRNAAPRHGVAAVADHLQTYADDLGRDISWRRDHGGVDDARARRLTAQISVSLAEGVRLACEGPRQLMDDRPTACIAAPFRPVRAPSRPGSGGERLRLCLLSQQYSAADGRDPAPPGGIAVWTRALAEAMAAAGHEVTVIARSTGPETHVRFDATADAGVWVHRVAVAPSVGPLRPDGLLAGLPASVTRPCLAVAQEVGRIGPRRRFDLVMGPLWDLEPAALLGRGAWPVAVSLHTACAQMAPFKPEWTRAYRQSHVDRVIAGERRLLARAPHVLANSAAAARDIAAALRLPHLPRRARLIPHGLPDLARGVRPTTKRAGGVEILFVGRLEPRKGVDVLLEAMAAVLAAAPDAHLTIVGEDTSLPGARPWCDVWAERQAGEPWRRRVRFAGALPHDELLARYAACDVVVVPSRYESFGLTALEAMVFAKPCVASDAGGLGEVVVHGETGLLVPPGDVDALARALSRLVGDAGLRARLGAAGRRRYETRFTATAMADAAEAWFREIIGARHAIAAE